jgi:uncharacterized protein (TIGR00251 family)
MNCAELQIRETEAGLEVPLHVQPRAKRCEISGIHGGALKLKVTAPPVDDSANRAILQFFSTLLGIPKSILQITSGLKSRDKVLRITGFSSARFLDRLGSL